MYAETCRLIKDCGFSGIDVHAMHWGYLLDEFANSLTNLRTDDYGGSLENRTRIMKELREAIAQSCGWDFPVTVRLGLRSYLKDVNHGDVTGEQEAGRALEESVEISKLLEKYGYDGLSVDTGVYESYYYACPPMYIHRGYAIEMAAKVQSAVSIPVMLGGRMGDAQMCEDAVAEGKISGVVLGRPSLADPDFPKKAIKNRKADIRPCIACNQGCLYRLNEAFLDARCAVNPHVNHGMDDCVTKATRPKKVIVIGGGVAGMEAARISALRGHDVSLYEKTGSLGGNLIPAGIHDFKVEIRELNQWYQKQINDLGVKIFLNEEMTPEKIKTLQPDTVILGTGSKAVMPPVPGIDSEKAVSCIDALMGRLQLGENIVVIGGGLVGCEIAYEAYLNGKNVSIVEGLPEILSSGAPVPHQNKSFLKETFASRNIPILTNTFLAGIDENGALIKAKDSDEVRAIPADSVVIAVGFRPIPSIAKELEGYGMEVYEVGDGKQVANILNAIWDAHEVASHI
ncbi:MAG: FAD-dependent oxidoreductase [Lachnospiraceae bacterium]|nr:FAD-dependent oxidoreductase [Lachnospiraceae bacterium]